MEVLFLGTVVVAVAVVLYRNTSQWALHFRQYMLKQSGKAFGYGFGWDEPWGLVLSKAMIVFFALMFIIFVYVVFFSSGSAVPRPQSSDICAPILPVDRSRELVNSLDRQTSEFASTTVDVSGRSAEGGTQTIFTQNGVRKIVEQRFYGETGRSYMRFYYEGNKVFAVVKLNISYERPISVDASGTVGTSEERDYYLDPNGRVCGAEINGVSQPIDGDTQDMIREYIAGIL